MKITSGYEAVFEAAFPTMTEAEQQLHGVVRAYTVNGLKPLNEAMVKWLQADTEFKLAASDRPHDVNVAKLLAELEPHLLMWLAKYAAWIPDSPAHALVYLADEENHGVPFPKGIEKVIGESLGIDTKAANKALQPAAAEEFARGRS